MNPNVLLQAWKPDFLDPMELYSKGMNMRALVDARKAQQIQRQFAIEDQERKRSLLQLLQSNPNATREEILQVDPFGGMAIIKEQDAQTEIKRRAEEAKARAEKTEQEILQAKRVWQAKLAASIIPEKDLKKQEGLFKQYTTGMRAVDMLTDEEAAEPFNPSLLWRIVERGLPGGAQDLRDKIAQAQREEEEETRKRLKFGPEFAKSKFEAEKAQRDVTGQEPTTEEKTFRNVFLPGYLKTNRLPPTDENVYQAYSEFQEAKRPRIGGVPGVDVPKPQAVIDQDVEKAKRIAEATRTATGPGTAVLKNKTLALKNLEDGINDYEAELKVTGPTFRPEKGAKLKALYTNLQMMTKSLFELGVITGPDMQILQGAIADPTEFKGNWMGTDALLKQLEVMKSIAKRSKSNLAEVYGGQPAEPDGPKPTREKWERDSKGVLRKVVR